MQAAEVSRAVAAAMSIASALGLTVDDAVTLWTYYAPATARGVAPADYAQALERLHAGMRKLDVATPHFTDRVAEAQQLVASRDQTPALAEADRELLGSTLRTLRRTIADRSAAEQLLHGEPHPGNVLSTNNRPLFIGLETCCRGPVEFDLAHVVGMVRRDHRVVGWQAPALAILVRRHVVGSLQMPPSMPLAAARRASSRLEEAWALNPHRKPKGKPHDHYDFVVRGLRLHGSTGTKNRAATAKYAHVLVENIRKTMEAASRPGSASRHRGGWRAKLSHPR